MLTDQHVIPPDALHHLAPEPMEDSMSLDAVHFKSPIEYLAVAQFDLAPTVLAVSPEVPFIFHPCSSQPGKVSVVEGLPEWDRLLIENATLPLELVVIPVTLVSHLPAWVVEFSIPSHPIVFPLAHVEPSL